MQCEWGNFATGITVKRFSSDPSVAASEVPHEIGAFPLKVG
jgi:hypothetical protein